MYLLDRHCEYPGCPQIFLGDDGTCEYCFQVRCTTHDALPYHECATHSVSDQGCAGREDAAHRSVECRPERADPSSELHGESTTMIIVDPEWEMFLRPLDEQVLASHAIALRPGHSCLIAIPTNVDELLGDGLFNQCNGHFPVLFDDGVEWLIRIRQFTSRSPNAEMQRMITASEVETMRVMCAAGLKVPNAWLVSEAERIEFKPGVKYDYFFVERVEGRPWTEVTGVDVGEQPSSEVLEAFIDDYARFQIGLADLPFRGAGIGSLFPGQTNDVAPKTGPLVTHFCFNRPEPPHFLGPFETNRERYLTHVDLILEMVAAGRYHQNDPVFSYLAHLHMRDIVNSLGEFAERPNEFYIKHADDKADQCMAAAGHITGVIDWEWAYVTTKAEAFSAPKFAFGTPDHQKGDNTPSNEEMMLVAAYERFSRPDLADCVRKGRVYNRLNNMIGYEPIVDELNALTRAAYGEDATATVFDSEAEWIEAAKQRYSDNTVLQRLIRDDEGQAEARTVRFKEDVARLTSWDRQRAEGDTSVPVLSDVVLPSGDEEL